MVFFKEEIHAFNLAYFEKLYASLESENAMQYYCRDTFRKGIVPELDEDVLKLIILDLEHRYMYDTRFKRSKWGHVSIPQNLLNCANRILAKVVVFRRLQADEMSRCHATERLRVEVQRKVNQEMAEKIEDLRRATAIDIVPWDDLWDDEVRRTAMCEEAEALRTAEKEADDLRKVNEEVGRKAVEALRKAEADKEADNLRNPCQQS